MSKRQKKIYLVINSKEDYENVIFKDNKEEIKAEVLEIVKNKSLGNEDLYVQIKSDKVIDDVIDIAEKNGFDVINHGKTYILNKCFQDTAYAQYGENICHEAINRFLSDNNKRYFFLCSNGKINSKIWNDKEWVFTGQNKTERLFLLENAQLISYSKYETGNKNKYAIIQKVEKLKLVEKNEEITYNGVNINNVFEENSFSKKSKMNGQEESTNESDFPSATFLGEEVKRPKTIGEKLFSYEDDGLEKLGHSTMRQFVFEGTTLYNKIEELLQSGDKWEDDEPIPFDKDCEEQDSVLGVIGKQERETYLSSLIAYAFKNSPSVLNDFLGENITKPYYVYREEKNVDILIRSKDKIIIIENKIEAGFSEGEKNWSDFIAKKEKDENTIKEVDSERYEGKKSQLEKYYRLAKYYAKIQGLSDNAIKCYLLCPEYKKTFYENHKKQYAAGGKYEVVSYKKLLESLEKREDSLKEDKKRIIDDLKCAIKMYTFNQNTYYMEQACNRFLMKINQKKLEASLIEE